MNARQERELSVEMALTAKDACLYAPGYAVDSGLHFSTAHQPSSSWFYPVMHPEESNLGIGVIEPYHYLIYLEYGFATFPMKELMGKIIPMNIHGRTVFRYAHGLGNRKAGRRVYWYRGKDGQLVPVNQQRRAWIHPGVPPYHFMHRAVAQAISDHQDNFRKIRMSESATGGAVESRAAKRIQDENRRAGMSAEAIQSYATYSFGESYKYTDAEEYARIQQMFRSGEWKQA